MYNLKTHIDSVIRNIMYVISIISPYKTFYYIAFTENVNLREIKSGNTVRTRERLIVLTLLL